MKLLYKLCALFGACFLLTACQKDETTGSANWQTIQEKKQVVIGVDDTFVPMGFRNDQDQLVGFDIDVARAVFGSMGIHPVFQTIDWSMKETELANHKIDVIWNGYTETAERAKKVRFSQRYLENRQVLVTRKSDKISSLADMKGKVLAVQEGSSGADVLKAEPKKLLDKVRTYYTYSSYTEAFLDLQAGRVQGVLLDGVFAEYFIAHAKDPSAYLSLPTTYALENYAVGVRKTDPELAKQINQALKTLQRKGTLAKISKKWFGEDKVLVQK